jgi:hypothetical protein
VKDVLVDPLQSRLFACNGYVQLGFRVATISICIQVGSLQCYFFCENSFDV